MRKLMLGAVLLTLCGPAAADWKDPHVKGAKEHPVIKYYPEARVSEYDQKEFDSAEIVTGYEPDGDPEVKVEEIEGRVTRYTWEHKPGTSPVEVLRQYENALTKAGFVKIVAGRTEKLPSSNVILGDTFGAFRLDRDGKPAIYVNLNATETSRTESEVVIVEPAALVQKLNVDADGLYRTITESGRVAVYGINFETGKATIQPESEEVLGQILKLMNDHKDLKLKVEGHTDNVGQPAANQKLSQARAAAVVSWLTKHGVKADRLTPAGFGDTKPVADNGTEEGRAKNRRVELAK